MKVTKEEKNYIKKRNERIGKTTKIITNRFTMHMDFFKLKEGVEEKCMLCGEKADYLQIGYCLLFPFEGEEGKQHSADFYLCCKCHSSKINSFEEGYIHIREFNKAVK